MKKRVSKITIMSLISSVIPITIASCSPTANKNVIKKYYDDVKNRNMLEILTYINENNQSYFTNLKNHIHNNIWDSIDDVQTANLIKLLDLYKQINDVKVASLYKGLSLTNNISEKDVTNSLIKIDKVINTTDDSYKKVDDALIEEAVQTLSLLESKNKMVIELNDEFDIFANELKSISFSNEKLTKIINVNIVRFFNDRQIKNKLVELIQSIEKNIKISQEIIDFYEGHSNSAVASKVTKIKRYLETFDTYTNVDLIKRTFETNVREFNDFVLTNNLVIPDLKYKKDNLENYIETIEFSGDARKEIENQIKKVYLYSQYDSVVEMINNFDVKVDELKNEFKETVKNSQITNENKNYLYEIIDATESYKDLEKLYSEFKKVNESLSKLNSTIANINSRISRNNFNEKYQLEFYKKLADYNSILEDNHLDDLNLFNFNETNSKLENLQNDFEAINRDEKKNHTLDNRTLLEIVKQETKDRWSLDITNKAKDYGLEEFAYSASHNFKNSKILFDTKDTEQYDYEIVDLQLDRNNWNKLKAFVKVTLKAKPEINYTFEVTKVYENDVKPFIEKTKLNNLDQIYKVDYHSLRKMTFKDFEFLTHEEKLKYFKTTSTKIGTFFDFELSNDFKYKDNRIYVTFKVMFNNQIISQKELSTINNVEFITNTNEKESLSDRIDEEEILKLLNGNISTLMSNVKIKPDAKYSHLSFLASEGVKALNELYEWPKFGKYQIFVKDVKNIDDFNGRADFIFWYKRDGIEVPVTNHFQLNRTTKRLGSFKLLSFNDIKPISGRNFTAADFDTTSKPNATHQGMINSINESNFFLRKAYGVFNNVNFRSLNPKDVVEQNYFTNLEYIIDLRNGQNQKGDNLDNQAYVPLDAKTYDKDIEVNSTNINDLRNNYFVYYYDVKSTGKRGMTFKLGFINKQNTSIRFTNGQEYTLINMVNDFQQSLYPEVMVNNIKLSDIQINQTLLSENDINYFANNNEQLNNAIKLRPTSDNEVWYKNFSLPINLFKVSQIKKISSNEAYIRFSVRNQAGAEVLADTWFRISGFKDISGNVQQDELEFKNQNLKVIQNSETEIIRERVIEPFWQDLLWKLDKKINVASWTFDKKYIEKTLLKTNAKSRTIKFNILANSLINSPSKNSRIRDIASSIQLLVDFDELLIKKNLEFKKSATTGSERFNYFIKLKWNPEKGIEFKISMEDNSYKIIVDEPEVQSFSEGQTFDKNRAFVILPAAVKATIRYTNDEEQENYNIDQNRFDYEKVYYNESNQPIMFYSDLDFQKDRSVYYPNQNVPYKLHEGYKLNVDYLRIKDYRGWDIVDSAYSRAIAIDGGTWWGTLSIIGKVNNNPNDATFYVITNHHVENGGLSSFSQLTGNNFMPSRWGRNYIFALEGQANNVDRNYNVRLSGVTTIRNNEIKLLWIGRDQISTDGKITNKEQDLSIFSVDLNKVLESARAAGNMQIVWKIENLMRMPNAKMDISYALGEISVPSIREVATLGWPRVQLAGSINRRPSVINHSAVQVHVQNYYSQVFNGGGGSGSGMYVNNDTYIATWERGWNGYWSQGSKYDNRSFNFLGVNWKNENPLSLANHRSLASQIFKANLKYPDKYDLPWYFKEIDD
ncbi:MGA_1079 family surface serine endopeptidase [Mycoplasmopsis edwardii]|uniref:Uncharacterized protein n=1 Tax=Mycoplasmopsis edwardii TaxID=53558 RepID=A0ACD4PIF7_9BACT|nr:hypothetical protein [Mycoplasmopsis edwardii]WBP83778.1 hypothetical protein Me_995_000397 [Mycoplasmopsis edwardii]